MPGFEFFSQGNAHLAAQFLAPGVVALYVRSRFVPGRTLAQPLIAYLAVSIAYHGLILSAIPLPLDPPWSITYTLAGPAAAGFLLGLEVRFGLAHSLLSRIGIQPIHAIPTAWDWKFSRMKPHWILVTFKDGTRIAGYCGRKSFISSDPSERDVYIEQIYDLDDNERWTPAEGKGLLILPGEISTIETWPCAEDENHAPPR